MSNPYAQFKTDAALETDGIDLIYDGFSIRVLRAGGTNRRFASALSKRTRGLRQGDEEAHRRAISEVLADTVVVGWRDVKQADNVTAIPFTRENVVKLFTDLPDLMMDVFQQASALGNFIEKDAEDDAGK